MAYTIDECGPNILTLHKWCCKTKRINSPYNTVGICVLQLSSVLVWNLGLLISVGLYSLQRIRCVLEEKSFFIILLLLSSDPSPLSLILIPHGTLSELSQRKITLEARSTLTPATSNESLSWWQRQKKQQQQFYRLNIIKPWQAPSP